MVWFLLMRWATTPWLALPLLALWLFTREPNNSFDFRAFRAYLSGCALLLYMGAKIPCRLYVSSRGLFLWSLLRLLRKTRWVFQNVQPVFFLFACIRSTGIRGTEMESAFLDHTSGLLVPAKMGDREEVQRKLFKAVVDDPADGFWHQPSPPVLFGENIPNLPPQKRLIFFSGQNTQLIDADRANHLPGFFVL